MKSVFFSLIILVFSLNSKANFPVNIPSQITVASYNLYGLKYESGIRKDLSLLPQVQIWAFQEVEGSFTEKTTQKIQSLLPTGKWYIVSQKVNLVDSKKGIWEGQVIASRFPISSTETLPLKHSGQKQRVALIANFKTEAGEDFFFANTDHEVKVFSLNFNDRKKQLLSLVDHFSKTKAKGIITGDFNTTGGQDEIKKTEAVLKQAGFSRSKAFDNDSYTFEKAFIKTELDHIFTRDLQVSPRYRLNERNGSDHFPIYLDVNL